MLISSLFNSLFLSLMYRLPPSSSILGSALTHFAKCDLSIRAMRLVAIDSAPYCVVSVVGKAAGSALESFGSVKSLSAEEAQELHGKPTTEVLSHCSLCIIKPHAIRNGNAGHILRMIVEAGFEISALKMSSVSRIEAMELLEVYKGVVSHYNDMIDELTSARYVMLFVSRVKRAAQSNAVPCDVPRDRGLCCSPLQHRSQLTPATLSDTRSCILIEVRSPEDVVAKFRALVGPIDVELAGVVRPDTIRAKYGESNARNGVHCSDLVESATEECEYAFRFIS